MEKSEQYNIFESLRKSDKEKLLEKQRRKRWLTLFRLGGMSFKGSEQRNDSKETRAETKGKWLFG